MIIAAMMLRTSFMQLEVYRTIQPGQVCRYDRPTMSQTLTIEPFELGMWQTNGYVVHAGGADCWIVDAGFEPGAMIDAIVGQGLVPTQLLLTHGHIDHIAGIEAVRERWADLPILIHDAERSYLTDPANNLSGPFGMPLTAPEATGTLAAGQTLSISGFTFEIRHTPGHSPGGVTLYCERTGDAIVGDTLFAGSIGRHDFPHSDGEALMRSIREQLLSLPDETKVHPGHGPATTIGRERASNPFLG